MTNRLIMFISVNLVFFPLMTMFLSKLVHTRIRSEALKMGAIELIVILAFLAILIKARK